MNERYLILLAIKEMHIKTLTGATLGRLSHSLGGWHLKSECQLNSQLLGCQFSSPSGKAAKGNQTSGYLAPMWETWMQLLTPGFSQSQTCQALSCSLSPLLWLYLGFFFNFSFPFFFPSFFLFLCFFLFVS